MLITRWPGTHGLNPDERESPEIAKLAEFTKNQSSIGGKATAYVYLNYNCKLPTTDIGKMLELLNVRWPSQKWNNLNW
jgi:uncharacterized protein YyaL (SSP411 family)